MNSVTSFGFDLNFQLPLILISKGITQPISNIEIHVPENLSGDSVQLVRVTFSDGRNPLELFIKQRRRNVPDPRMLESGLMSFKKEATFYNEYLPVAISLCEFFRADILKFVYGIPYFADENTIILENLSVTRGLQAERELLDFDSALASVDLIAKHHAISAVLISNYGGHVKFFERFTNLDFQPFSQSIPVEILGHIMEIGIARNCKILQRSQIHGKEEAIKFLEGFAGKAYAEFLGCTKLSREDEDIGVLLHGDYAKNNIMLRRNDSTGDISDCVLIDFQMTFYGSSCLDLAYFFFTSVQHEVRELRLNDLLRNYTKIFNRTTHALGSALQISYEDLRRNFCLKVPFGFWIGIVHEVGFEAVCQAEINPEKCNDRKEYLSGRNDCILKWLEEHPQQAEVVALNIFSQLEQLRSLMSKQMHQIQKYLVQVHHY